MNLPEGSDDESRFWGELWIAAIAAMVNVLLNDGQAKRKVSKLVGSWAVAENLAKLIRQTPRPNQASKLGTCNTCFEASLTSFAGDTEITGALTVILLGRASGCCEQTRSHIAGIENN